MSGTDVAQEKTATEEQPRKGNSFLTFLRVWLPFPLILGAIVYFQFKSGKLDRPEPEVTESAGVFEGAGADLPLLLQALTEERTELESEWERLRFVERRISLEAGEIQKRRSEVEDLLTRIEAKVRVMEEERDRMLGQLARVYETMKPDAAAEILSGIEVDTSTEIIRRMKERSAAQVMASLDPRSAARISQRMLRP
jgi:flagellar motility protein MotE (MotC chaperone)